MNTWNTDVAPMPMALARAGFATNGFEMNVAGGRSGRDRVAAAETEFFTFYPAKNEWVQMETAQLPVGLAGITGAVRANKSFIILGGEAPVQLTPNEEIGLTASGTFTRVDRFNFLTEAWEQLPSLPEGRKGVAPLRGYAWQKGDKVPALFVAGGGSAAGGTNPATDSLFILHLDFLGPPASLPEVISIP